MMATGREVHTGLTGNTGDVAKKQADGSIALNKPGALRSASTASSATPTPDSDTTDTYALTALAEAATFGAPTGAPYDGQKLTSRITDNGTARALAWNGAYRAVGVALPTTTVLGKTVYLGFIYNDGVAWDLVASAQEA